MRKNPNKEPHEEGKLIQEHLENINMDAWYYIYQVYVNPPQKSSEKPKD